MGIGGGEGQCGEKFFDERIVTCDDGGMLVGDARTQAQYQQLQQEHLFKHEAFVREVVVGFCARIVHEFECVCACREVETRAHVVGKWIGDCEIALCENHMNLPPQPLGCDASGFGVNRHEAPGAGRVALGAFNGGCGKMHPILFGPGDFAADAIRLPDACACGDKGLIEPNGGDATGVVGEGGGAELAGVQRPHRGP